MLSSYFVEYIKHGFNSLNYKRKEKNVFENENFKLNTFYDSFYVKNNKAYVIISNDFCKNNICSYCVVDKRVNIYVIRIKKYDKNDILECINLIEKTHNKILLIHAFKLSNIILSEQDFFKKNWTHISITPFYGNYNHSSSTNFYFNFFYGERDDIVSKSLIINKYLKNVYLINISSNSIFENSEYINNNIKIKYTKSDLYLSLESLNIGRKKVNDFK